MKSLLLPLHLIFAGLWLGCVLTEVLFERALLGKGRAQELLLAHLHVKVDLFVEVPAFVAVLVTGGLMLPGAAPGAGLQAMVGFGLLAIAANAWCVHLVFRRRAHARAQRWEAFASADHQQHRVGSVVLLALMAALAAGVFRHAGA